MLKLLLRTSAAAIAIASAQPVLAQNLKPTDVPTPVLQTMTYASGTTKNTLGPTGTATTPDTPPYFASMPADIPTIGRTGWLFSDPSVTDGSTDFENCGNLTVNCEAKFRSHIATSHILYDDPIRNSREPGTSHCHQFFGNGSANAYSTYATLRNSPRPSTAIGGELNKTAYWIPCLVKVNPFVNNKNYAVKMGVAALYYNDNNTTSEWLVRLPRGLRYVGGMMMDDPENTTRRREVEVANAPNPGRYSIDGEGHGFNGWQCLSGDGAQASPTLVPHLKTPAGTDPWGGTCTVGTGANAGKPATIMADINGPSCWDGINPWVPGGYDHMRYKVNDTQLNAAKSEKACPNGRYHVPSIRLEIAFPSQGWNDYKDWRLSSDDAFQAKLNSLPTCTTDATGAYANAPCATRSGGGPLGAYWNGSSYVIPNGVSFHIDWFGAWDDETFRTWMANCTGVRGLLDGSGNPLPSTPHTCKSSVIKLGTRMNGGVPPVGSRYPNPIIDMFQTFNTSNANEMYRIRTISPYGTHDVHVH